MIKVVLTNEYGYKLRRRVRIDAALLRHRLVVWVCGDKKVDGRRIQPVELGFFAAGDSLLQQTTRQKERLALPLLHRSAYATVGALCTILEAHIKICGGIDG